MLREALRFAGSLVLFALWALVGTAASYGSLYAFSPYGVAILGTCLAVALLLPALGGDRLPEGLGLFAGAGVFAILIAANSDYAPGPWFLAGGAIVGGTVVAYAFMGRARCSHPR